MLKFNVVWKEGVASQEQRAEHLSLAEYQKLAGDLLRSPKCDRDSIFVKAMLNHVQATEDIRSLLDLWMESLSTDKGMIDNLLFMQVVNIYTRRYIAAVYKERQDEGKEIPKLSLQDVEDMQSFLPAGVKEEVMNILVEVSSLSGFAKEAAEQELGILPEWVSRLQSTMPFSDGHPKKKVVKA